MAEKKTATAKPVAKAAVKVGYQIKDGKKVRVNRKTGAVID